MRVMNWRLQDQDMSSLAYHPIFSFRITRSRALVLAEANPSSMEAYVYLSSTLGRATLANFSSSWWGCRAEFVNCLFLRFGMNTSRFGSLYHVFCSKLNALICCVEYSDME